MTKNDRFLYSLCVKDLSKEEAESSLRTYLYIQAGENVNVHTNSEAKPFYLKFETRSALPGHVVSHIRSNFGRLENENNYIV